MLKFVLIATLTLATSAAAQPSLERGGYLVNAVMACDGCHTPRGPNGLVMEKRFSGGSQTWDNSAYTVKGSNITPDPETGIGRWSETDVKLSLTEGLRPHGMPLAPQMPFVFYKIMTVGDLDAVVAYLRSVPAVRNPVQAPVYRDTTRVESIPRADRPLDESALRNPVQRGFYLGTLAHCMECHSRRPDGQQDFSNWLGKGGHEMTGPWGKAVVPNITSHSTKGIGGWSDTEIKRALTHGVARDGRPFKQPMARQIYYGKMEGADLDAIVAWLRTLPPLE